MNETILMHDYCFVTSEEAAKQMHSSVERLMCRQPITVCKESKGVSAA